MRTDFTPEQLKDPDTARSNAVLRACVHCGFCMATCPTYQILGDERDSPRGRIYLIKEMLESGRPADAATVTHIDRCLSCLACMTTCPSGVHYMHLIDHARAHVERTHRRPLPDRALRWLIARVLPYPRRLRLALAPRRLPPPGPGERPGAFPAEGARRARVALLTGCAQKALGPDINAATIRLLTRLGCEVVVAQGQGCCGALTHHMGRTDAAHRTAAPTIRAWAAEIDGAGLDAIVINTSGCGTTVKDYGHMFRVSPLAGDAARVAALARDVTEWVAELGLPEGAPKGLTVAYHAACSLQHGQGVTEAPKALLRRAGFDVVEPADAHLCCGSAGTYNLLQPELSAELRRRKVATLEAKRPDLIATGNLGCITQIGTGTALPVVHTVALLDWATGGPRPAGLGS